VSHVDTQLGAWLVIAGSVVFTLGISPVPRVYSERDPAERLRMLTARRALWQKGQSAIALGILIVAVGVLLIDPPGTIAAGVMMLLGSIVWIPGLGERGRNIEGFAAGELAPWPYYGYAIATLAGLALLLPWLFVDEHTALAWFVAGASAFFAAVLAITRDLPPFVFYVVLLVVAVVLL